MYKPESREFCSRRGNLISFNLSDPFRRFMTLGFTQILTEMSTRNILGSKVLSARKAGLENVESPTSHNPGPLIIIHLTKNISAK